MLTNQIGVSSHGGRFPQETTDCLQVSIERSRVIEYPLRDSVKSTGPLFRGRAFGGNSVINAQFAVRIRRQTARLLGIPLTACSLAFVGFVVMSQIAATPGAFAQNTNATIRGQVLDPA